MKFEANDGRTVHRTIARLNQRTDGGHRNGGVASQPRAPATREDLLHQHAVSARHRAATPRGLAQEQKPSEASPGCRFSAGDVTGDLVLVERLPDGGQVSRKFSGERGMIAGGIGKEISFSPIK